MDVVISTRNTRNVLLSSLVSKYTIFESSYFLCTNLNCFIEETDFENLILETAVLRYYPRIIIVSFLPVVFGVNLLSHLGGRV